MSTALASGKHPAAWQEERVAGPDEGAGEAGCGARWGGQGRSPSPRGSGRWQDVQPKARSALGWPGQLPRVMKGCLFSASGDVSISPQGRASDHSFYFLCSPSKEKKCKTPANRTRGRAGDQIPQSRERPPPACTLGAARQTPGTILICPSSRTRRPLHTAVPREPQMQSPRNRCCT